MKLACPACRAENSSGPNCRRCKADLSLLIGLENRRAGHVARSRQAIQEGRLDQAVEELQQAQNIRIGTDVHRQLAWVYLLAGDFPSAWIMYQNSQ